MSVRSIEAEVSIKSGVQAECSIGREVIVEVHDDVNLEPLTVTANGQYEPSGGVDGFSDVYVQVPERVPITEALSVTENGTYEPAEGVDGYDMVMVNVPIPAGFKATGSFTRTVSSQAQEIDVGRTDWDYLLVVPRDYPYTITEARCLGLKLVDKKHGHMISAFGASGGGSDRVTTGSDREVNTESAECIITGSVVSFSGAQTTVGRFVAGCTYDWVAW